VVEDPQVRLNVRSESDRKASGSRNQGLSSGFRGEDLANVVGNIDSDLGVAKGRKRGLLNQSTLVEQGCGGMTATDIIGYDSACLLMKFALPDKMFLCGKDSTYLPFLGPALFTGDAGRSRCTKLVRRKRDYRVELELKFRCKKLQ
jgi:hypothetical protein